MTQEEKAKAYDELKVRAQELEEDGCFDKITLFDLFPELAESEDEKIRKSLIDMLKNDEKCYLKEIDWLESLKDRLQPQRTWKPSDEQIDALDFAADCIVPDEFCYKRKALKELLKELKAL